MVYSTRLFVLCLTLYYFVLVFFSPLSIAITWLGEERALVWFCLFPLPLGIWEGLRFVIVALPGFFSYLIFAMIFLLSLYEDDPEEFICRVVTQEKTSAHHFEYEAKKAEYVSILLRHLLRNLRVSSAGKVMTYILWYSQDVIIVD